MEIVSTLGNKEERESFFYPDPWQQQHLAYVLTSEPPPQLVCSQNRFEPQPVGTAAIAAAQSCASAAVEEKESRKMRARRAARRKESGDFISLFICFSFGSLCCSRRREAACVFEAERRSYEDRERERGVA